ncbi:hypothetical protein [Streptomyces syringium]|uniref:hypothetical protein n=1 Tax=Streptomyces syringium TaxID=76729 RepID=UPI003AAB8A7A
MAKNDVSPAPDDVPEPMWRELVRQSTNNRKKKPAGAYRAASWTVRAAIRHRRPLAPIATAIGIATAGGMLGAAPDGWKTALVMDAAAAATVTAWARYRGLPWSQRKRRMPSRADILWAASAAGSAGALITAMALTGGPGFGPSPYWGLMLGWLGVFGAYWWKNRCRRSQQPSPELTDQMLVWQEYVTCPGGPLPGFQLTDPLTTDYGWTATIVAPRGKATAQDAASKLDKIASAFDVDLTNIAIEPVPGSSRRAILAVFHKNPLQEKVEFGGPAALDHASGIAVVGTFYDHQSARYRFYKPGDGAVHSFIVGATGSGKSRFLEILLSLERCHPGIVSWVCDPQNGQSLPAWQTECDWYAPGVEESYALIKAAHAIMLERNERYGQMQWSDSKGRKRRGKSFFNVGEPDPLLSLTIDEAHAVLNYRDAAELVADIAKMGRKCGIKLRLATQVPTVDQLGSDGASSTLREQLQGGNIIVFRCGSAMSSRIALGSQLDGVDASTIPKYWPGQFDAANEPVATSGLGYISGPDGRSGMFRSAFLSDDDAYDYATAGSLATLEKGAENVTEIYGRARHAMAERRAGRNPGPVLVLDDETENGFAEGLAQVLAQAQAATAATPTGASTATTAVPATGEKTAFDPELAKLVGKDAAKACAKASEPAPGTGDRITQLLLSHGRPMTRAAIVDRLGIQGPACSNALKRLANKNLVVSLGDGLWAHARHASKSETEVLAEAESALADLVAADTAA